MVREGEGGREREGGRGEHTAQHSTAQQRTQHTYRPGGDERQHVPRSAAEQPSQGAVPGPEAGEGRQDWNGERWSRERERGREGQRERGREGRRRVRIEF